MATLGMIAACAFIFGVAAIGIYSLGTITFGILKGRDN